MHSGQQLVRVLAAGAGGAPAAPVVAIAQRLRRAGSDVGGDELVQRGRRPIRDRRHPGPAQPTTGTGLDRDHGEDLLAAGPATGQAGFQATDEGHSSVHVSLVGGDATAPEQSTLSIKVDDDAPTSDQ